MTATLFTTRIHPATLAGINTLARTKKQTKRQIIEQAIDMYILSQKRSNIRTSFQWIWKQKEIMELTEVGLEEIHNV